MSLFHYNFAMIRNAEEKDIPGLNRLLEQVLKVHHDGRPDLWRDNAKKYTDEQLKEILRDKSRPIFVSVDEGGYVQGYAFCIYEEIKGDNVRADCRTLYIDDLCVDEKIRGKHIGTSLYNHVLDFARKEGFYNVTLNVWESNTAARKFYDAMGLVPLKTCLEKIL